MPAALYASLTLLRLRDDLDEPSELEQLVDKARVLSRSALQNSRVRALPVQSAGDNDTNAVQVRHTKRGDDTDTAEDRSRTGFWANHSTFQSANEHWKKISHGQFGNARGDQSGEEAAGDASDSRPIQKVTEHKGLRRVNSFDSALSSLTSLSQTSGKRDEEDSAKFQQIFFEYLAALLERHLARRCRLREKEDSVSASAQSIDEEAESGLGVCRGEASSSESCEGGEQQLGTGTARA